MKLCLVLAITFVTTLISFCQSACQTYANKDIDGGCCLDAVHGKAEHECCAICEQTNNCKAYAWSDYMGGTCFLKTSTTPVINQPGVKIGILQPGQCKSYPNTDIDTPNLKQISGQQESKCCSLCKETAGCRGYAWNNYEGGTCWLKSTKGPRITKTGVTTGLIDGSPGPTQPPQPTGDHVMTIENKCPFTIWPGALGNSIPRGGGWEMASHSSVSFNLPKHWSGRFWARTGCRNDGGRLWCDTGDCGGRLACAGAGGVPPVSLAEFTFDGDAGKDFYDVSLVDGYNVQLRIDVQGSHDPRRGDYYCADAGCTADLNQNCPNALKVEKHGNTVACKSACEKFNTDQYCCRGAHKTPDTCIPSRWPVNYAKIFKEACPKAYSYAYDDKLSTFTCKGSKTGYKITFCP